MLGFGLLGVLLEFAKVPLAPFVVGLVLAPVAEVGAALRADGVGGQLHAADRTSGCLHDAGSIGCAFRLAVRADLANDESGRLQQRRLERKEPSDERRNWEDLMTKLIRRQSR